MTSSSVEDYLKTIYQLQQEAAGGAAWVTGGGPDVSTSALAERLSVAPASVTSMIQRLAQVELLIYTPYQGVHLTEQGEKMALRVIRRHRLLELYLAERLGLSWDQVHEEAERLEHHISATLEEHIAAALGNPQVDPHGHPIPTVAGEVAAPPSTRLDALPVGQEAVVLSVQDNDAALLRYLAAREMFPGMAVVITEREPFGGSIHLRVGSPAPGRDYTLSLAAAARVRVTGVVPASPPPAAATDPNPAPTARKK
jgi:DtxR family Mn-dependent transcriptional regulator